MIRAVVFDLDGVLIDSETVWESVRHEYVIRHGGVWPADAQHRLMGMSTGEWSRYLADELHVDRSPDDVARDVVGQMADRYAHGLPLLPGAVATVRTLADRFRLGLASSSPRTLIDTVLWTAGLTDAFAVTRSTEEEQRGKPAPDVYLSVATAMHAEPVDCVAVEDSTNGVRSASAAGMTVIAIPRPAYPVDQAVLRVAARVLSDVTELPEALSEIS